MIQSESGSGSQDFDLNLAPIIDCFTVLITFMLVSASFLSIGILDAGISAAGAEQTDPSRQPKLTLAVEITSGREIRLQLNDTGKARSGSLDSRKLDPVKGEPDFGGLQGRVEEIRKRYPELGAAILSGSDGTEYKDLVRAMEITRRFVPNVILGGF